MTAGYTRENDTGQGATIVFADYPIVADFKTIGETKQVSQPVEDTPISAGFNSFIPGDVINAGETECELIFNRRAALPPLNTPTLVTITFPVGPGDDDPATYVGTGFLTERSIPQLASQTLQMSKVKIKWDCKGTLPAFTPATEAV
jgi:hypothetical protein